MREVIQAPESRAIFGPRPSAEDRDEIIDVVSAFALFGDMNDFAGMRALLAPNAVMDYREAGRGLVPAVDRIDALAKIFPGFDATQHRVSNFQVGVIGDEATCFAHVYATHVLGEEQWIVGALYTRHLKRINGAWKLTLIKAKFLFEDGPLDLMEKAAARCAK